MFCGPWFSWPWFAFNGFAVGSPTRWREMGFSLLGFGVCAILVGTVVTLAFKKILVGYAIEYAFIGVTLWKLWISYYLFILQVRTFHLYEYYGGAVRNGFLPLLLTAIFIGPRLFAFLRTKSSFLFLVLR
jgi:hypothetical protein